ncbi:ABC transporter permease [Paludibaculum fermentans]|uniref:ABC transporter permease n=1 Tax=Paludibaculum fermentans TaxID=1473598 RepID=A0A7S7NPP9_PALFE|nr:ABC transporter permease [Paludibaculum fermentans]QOY87497.1 ABC transporter permease [Paludibaculum fermentans]
MFSELRLRIKAALHRRRLDRDLEEEVAYHLQRRADSLREAGDPDPEHAALRRFGNPSSLRENLRDQWSFPRLESIWQDLRYAARLLRNSPGFTAVAVLSLALAIGANTSIFTVIDAILLKTLPVPEPGQLLILRNGSRVEKDLRWSRTGSMGSLDKESGLRTSSVFPFPAFQKLQAQLTSASVFSFASLFDIHTVVQGRASMGSGHMVSGNYFQVLGVHPGLGRLLDEADDRPGAPRVAVVSHRFWQTAMASDPAIVGRTLGVNTVSFTIVGVAPPGFYGVSVGGFISAPDVYVPLQAQPLLAPYSRHPSQNVFQASDFLWLNIMARTRPGASRQSTAAEATNLWRQFILEQGFSKDPGRDGFRVVALPGAQGIDSLRSKFERPLVMLQVVVGLVLLIACANLASLLLARSESRRREIHVRLALGAARVRLLRQFLTESLLLGALAAALGVLLSQWGTRILVSALLEREDALRLQLQPDLRVLLFSLALSLLTVFLFGLAPAFRATRTSLAPEMHRTARTAVLGRAVIVTQVALSLVLLAGAALFLRTLQNLYSVQLGFNKDNVLIFAIDPTRNGVRDQQLVNFYEALRARLRAIPTVRSVSASNETLVSGWYSSSMITMNGAAGTASQPISMQFLRVTPDFFETMGIQLPAGRGILESDTASAPSVVVMSEAAARRVAPSGSPIGRTFQWTGKWGGKDITVVGVARDTRPHDFTQPIEPTLYVPYLQGPWDLGRLHFELRTSVSAREVLPLVRQAVQDLDANLPLYQVRTQSEQVDERFTLQRVLARACTAFGLVALLLACIGIYGLIAHSAARRTAEIGVRVALGARPPDIVWLVLRQAALLAAIGIVAGVGLSLLCARLVEASLYQVKATDPAALAAAALILALTVLAAGFLPARRAARVDPVSALKYE